MAATVPSRTLTIRIERPLQEVYDFASVPENFARWAAGLGKLTERVGDRWRAETPQGPVQVRFTAPNPFGVLDHYVTLTAGTEIAVPTRVIANGDGTELLFTVFRLPGMSDAQFADDTAAVERDLQTLKALLEA